MDTARLGQAIRFHRKAAGLSRAALCELAGIGKTALFDLEHGKETVQMRTALRVLHVLSMDFAVTGPLMSQFEASQDD